MASFDLAIPKYLAKEGGFSDRSNDRGGLTYRGISSKYWPNWEGWAIVREHMRRNGGTLPWNYIIKDPGLETMVRNFYRSNFWDPMNASYINNQSIAEVFVDFGINAGRSRAKKFIQQAANIAGAYLRVDGLIGRNTISAINSVDQKTLHQNYKDLREEHYRNLAEKDPTQKDNLEGWLTRNAYWVFENEKKSLGVCSS